MKLLTTAILCITVGCLSFSQSSAQSNSKSIISSVLNKVVASNTGIGDIDGNWIYQGAACHFESDNILKQAGGAVAANQVEREFDEYLSKVGIRKGAGAFIFNADKTYSATLGRTKLNGNYTIDESSKTITLTYLKGVAKINASVAKSGNHLNLLFDADNLLKLLKLVGSATNNTTLKAVTTFTNAYDGVQLGFDLQKK